MSTVTPHSASPDPEPAAVAITTTQTSSDAATALPPESPRTESQQSHEDSISPTSTAVNPENPVTITQSVGPMGPVTSRSTQPQKTPQPATPALAANLPSPLPHISQSKILWPKWLTGTSSGNQLNTTRQWGVHWYSPTCMLSLLVLGLFTMLGHHLFNDRLHGNEVHDPQWPQRWGLALSTFGKVCLAGAVEIAYKQRLWITVKKRSFKIKTLNGIFSACYDPLEFLNVELVRNATVMTLLAGLIWVLPLCVIVSPATLTSISTIRNTSTICDNIQTIEFTHDNNANISAPIESSVVNDGRQGLAYIDLMPSNTSIAYYTSPSMNLQRISTLSLLSNFGPLQASNPCVGASNCSYQLSFKGPSYDCQEAPRDNPHTIQAKSQLAPSGEAIYTSFSDVDEDQDGAPMNWQFVNPANESMLGTFTQEPSLWIGYVINTTLPVLPFNSSSNWPYILEPHVLQCVLLNVTYHYDIKFLNGLMHIDHSSTTDQIPLLADGESIHPLARNYGDFMGNHAAGFIFRNTLSGTVNQTSAHHWTRSFSSISQTPLLNQTSQYAVSDFPNAISRQFADQIISLSTSPVLYAQVNITAPCTMSNAILIWNYKPLWLVLSYSLAVLFAVIAVIEGLFAFARNGYSADTNFSTILATTRNVDLDRLAEEMCLGQSPPPKSFMEEGLRFGQVRRRDGQGGAHAAFGLPGDVGPIICGDKYT